MFGTLLWRQSLQLGPPTPTALDLEDWGDVLAAAREAAGAAGLRDVAAILRGFGDRSPEAPGRWTIGILLDELASLARDLPLSLTAVALPRVSGRPDEPAGIGPATPPVAGPADPLASAAALRALLSAPTLEADDAGRLHTIMAQLDEADRRLPGFDYRAWSLAPLPELAAAITLGALIGFARSCRDLVRPPLGSARLLHRAARLDPAGLGAYFGGVGRAIRDPADLFALARHAAGAAAAGTDATDATQAWVALLARGHADVWQFMAIVDTLGDGAASAVLAIILDRTMAVVNRPVDLALVRRLRDIGLDNADWAVATRAQAHIVRVEPAAYHERVILGSIEATGGDFGSAEGTFRDCLLLRPDDVDVVVRLAAVRRNRFDGFAVAQGFETPADRQETRLRRRGVLPGHTHRKGERIHAVDVS